MCETGRFEGLDFGSALRRVIHPYGVHISTVTHYTRGDSGRGHERASRFTLAVAGSEGFGPPVPLSESCHYGESGG